MQTVTQSIDPAFSDNAVTRERRYASRADGAATQLEVVRESGGNFRVYWSVRRRAWRARGWKATRPSEAAAMAFANEKWPALVAWLEALELPESDRDGAADAFSAQLAGMR